jgi:chaperonin cofactor prefoldin
MWIKGEKTMNLKEITKIESTIDNLLSDYDLAMSKKNYEKSVNIVQKIEKELEKLDDNEISIDSESIQ